MLVSKPLDDVVKLEGWGVSFFLVVVGCDL
jgi:hypothetical protein